MKFSRQRLLGVPGVVFSILPFGGCPACWPVYAGVLSAVGLNFLLSREYLFPLTVVFLLVAVASLLVKRRRGHAPFALGLTAASLVLIGKFAITSDALTYTGATLLVFASVYNAWPRRMAAPCPKCAPLQGGLIQLSAQEKSS